MSHEPIISFILSPPDLVWLSVLRVVFIAVSVIFSALIALFLFKNSWLKVRFGTDIFEFLTYRAFWVKKAARQWAKIVNRLETGLESEYKLAVIEADSMLDDVLRRMGFSGESFGERLKKVPKDVISNIGEVELAHKVRNNIVHDPDYYLSHDEAKKTLDIFEKALNDLEVL